MPVACARPATPIKLGRGLPGIAGRRDERTCCNRSRQAVANPARPQGLLPEGKVLYCQSA
jgi:hypothetical protein